MELTQRERKSRKVRSDYYLIIILKLKCSEQVIQAKTFIQYNNTTSEFKTNLLCHLKRHRHSKLVKKQTNNSKIKTYISQLTNRNS